MRIAILGGTFDPIHNGHLAAAEKVASSFEVDEVHFVPSFSPPHKAPHGITSSFHRFAMVALATLPFPNFRASTIEVDSFERRYTVETLDEMRRIYPACQLLLVMGTDMYQEIQTWREFRRLFELAHVVVINRPGFPMRQDIAAVHTVREGEAMRLADRPQTYFVPSVEQKVSSTAIREEQRRGGEIRGWVPEAVWNYIGRHGLYT